MQNGDLRIHDGIEVGPGVVAGRGPGLGLPRGAARRPRALGHDQGRQDRRTTRRSSPRTWNAGPAGREGQPPGPYEASLVDTPVADPEQPLEILRTIHSFDPCLACAVHVVDATGRERVRVEVR